MNLKSILGLKATATISNEHEAMADKAATLKGCGVLVSALESALSATPTDRRAHRHIVRQLEEARRVLKGHVIEADRARMISVHKRDTDAARAAQSAADKAMAQAEAAAGAAAQARNAMEERISPITTQLATERRAADAKVDAAREAFAKVMSGPADEAAEAASAKALRDAQTDRKDAGATLTLRLDSLTAELRRLEQVEQLAASARAAASTAVAEARAEAARVAFDIAAQGALDAHLKCMHVRSSATSAHSPKPFNLFFYSSERVLWGAQLCGDNGELRDWVIGDMAKCQREADLVLLCSGAPEEVKEQPAVLANVHDFIAGSVEFQNAQLQQERPRAAA